MLLDTMCVSKCKFLELRSSLCSIFLRNLHGIAISRMVQKQKFGVYNP